jgi:hypothetical protein
MRKLGELKLEYVNSPKMLNAVNQAIVDFGPDAKCLIVLGQASFHMRSNIVKSVKCVDDILGIYPGAKRRYKSEGYYNIVVVK